MSDQDPRAQERLWSCARPSEIERLRSLELRALMPHLRKLAAARSLGVRPGHGTVFCLDMGTIDAVRTFVRHMDSGEV